MEFTEAIFDDLYTDYETESNKKYYNAIAEPIISYAGEYTYNKKVESIVDICCGTGILANKLAIAFPEAEIIGLDISGQMLCAAKKKEISNVRLIQYDVNDIGKLNLKADMIVCNYGMQWLKKDVVYDIAHSLNNGGVFICSLPGYTLGTVELDRKSVEYTGNRLFNIILHLSKRMKPINNYPKEIIKSWSSRIESNDIIETALDCGFKLVMRKVCTFLTEFSSVHDMVYSIISRGTFGNVLANAGEEYMLALLNEMEHYVARYNNMIEENVTEYIMLSKNEGDD